MSEVPALHCATVHRGPRSSKRSKQLRLYGAQLLVCCSQPSHVARTKARGEVGREEEWGTAADVAGLWPPGMSGEHTIYVTRALHTSCCSAQALQQAS